MVLAAVGASKTITAVQTKPVRVEFSTNSTTLVDVTTATNIAHEDTHTIMVRAYDKMTGWDAVKTIQVEWITTDEVTVIGTITNVSNPTYAAQNFTGIKNSTGGQLLYKLRTKISSAAASCQIQADTAMGFSAPLTNLTDLFQVSGVTTIRLWGTVTDGIFGVANDVAKDGFSDIPVNAVVKRFVWSANSGNILWDWSGVQVTLTA